MQESSRCVVLLKRFALALAGLTQVLMLRASEPPPLVPTPVRLDMAGEQFEITGQTVVTAAPGAEAEARKLSAALRGPSGSILPLAARQDGNNRIHLELDPSLEARLGSEGYLLSVQRNGVSIRAAGEAGLFYGAITLGQLLPPAALVLGNTGAQSTASSAEQTPASEPAGRWSIPGVEIEDYPRFRWRGLLIDVARHFMPISCLKKMVDLCALHKLNRLQLHLTDDQGWRIEVRKWPRLTEIGSMRRESPRPGDPARGDGQVYGPYFYTQDEIRDLVAYGQARHVLIVPEIEMPGHFLAALAAYPEYSCRGGPFEVRTRWGVHADILCPGNERSFAFVEDILSEVLELFPSPFIHIGGDEAPRERWKECPKCQARMRAEGLKNEAELQTYLNRRIEDFLARHGRRLIGWDETVEGGLTPGAAVMSWRGTEGGLAAARAGHDVVMSPTSHCYFDYAQSKEPGEPESIGGYIPLRKVYEFEPVPSGLAQSRRHHILGAQGNVWTEFIWTPSELEYFAFPRAVALAEVVWSPAAHRNFADFRRRLGYSQGRLDRLGVNYRKLDDKPSGD